MNDEIDVLAADLVDAAANFAVDRLNTLPQDRRAWLKNQTDFGGDLGVLVRPLSDNQVIATICLVDTDGQLFEISQHKLKKPAQ